MRVVTLVTITNEDTIIRQFPVYVKPVEKDKEEGYDG